MKILVPATIILIATSLRQRKNKEIVLYSSLLMGGGMLTNEIYFWNRVSGRLYLTMKSDSHKND
jgi:uncharacterized membrane protein YwaF